MCADDCLSCCECGVDELDRPDLRNIIERYAGGFITGDGAKHSALGDFNLGQVVEIGTQGQVPHGRLPAAGLPFFVPPGRRRRGGKAPDGIPLQYIKVFPVRRVERVMGNGIRDYQPGYEQDEQSPGPRSDWLPVDLNRVRWLRLKEIVAKGYRYSWIDRANGVHSGVNKLQIFPWRVDEAEIEFSLENSDHGRVILNPPVLPGTLQPGQPPYLLTIFPEPSAADHAVLLDGSTFGFYSAGAMNPVAPGIPNAEPMIARAVELMSDRWRVHVRLFVQTMSWDGPAGEGNGMYTGYQSITASIQLHRFDAVIDIALDGQPLGATVQPRVLVAQTSITDTAPQPGAAYIAALAGRRANLDAWLDALETPEQDLSTPSDGVTLATLTATGPELKVTKGIWRVPVASTAALKFTGLTPLIAGKRLVSYDSEGVWLKSDADPLTPGQTQLPVFNPGFAAQRRTGIRPRSAAPVDSYFATPARELLQYQPGTATLINLQTFQSEAVDASSPWYSLPVSLGDGVLQVKFEDIPPDSWDMWCLMVREVKSAAPPSMYQGQSTTVNCNLDSGQQSALEAASWHLRTESASDSVTATISPAQGRAIAGVTLILAKIPPDAT